MVLLRHLLGDALRRLRLRQGRTLREVSAAARVSLGYLSEVERGQKEASSELLASICGALGAPLSHVLREVSDNFALAELQNEPVFAGVREPAQELPAGAVTSDRTGSKQPVGAAASQRIVVPATPRQPVGAGQRLMVPAPQKVGSRTGQRVMTAQEPLLDPASLPVAQPEFDQVTFTAREITNMVPV
jgi:transcriptional regulator with XRE-family HTH domain